MKIMCTLGPGLSEYDPLAMIRLLQRSHHLASTDNSTRTTKRQKT